MHIIASLKSTVPAYYTFDSQKKWPQYNNMPQLYKIEYLFHIIPFSLTAKIVQLTETGYQYISRPYPKYSISTSHLICKHNQIFFHCLARWCTLNSFYLPDYETNNSHLFYNARYLHNNMMYI